MLTFEYSRLQLGEAPVGQLGAPTAAPVERVAIGEGLGAGPATGSAGGGGAGASGSGAGGGAGGGMSDEDALQARLDSLRRD